MKYSFVIPVYNRPDDIELLLGSMVSLEDRDQFSFEIVIVEDGSKDTCRHIIEQYQEKLSLQYWYKSNSGPGDSRNFGMQKANGDYFLILDSDVILPVDYLLVLEDYLSKKKFHCFGGNDTAHKNFNNRQKAISYVMTSYLTTGGIRGKKNATVKFQPRSFNMGLSREAFEASGGFGKIHPGEDPDLVFRLWDLGYDTACFDKLKVYHKRRITWKGYFRQHYKFGKVRPILTSRFPGTAKLTYWFPFFFILGALLSVVSYMLDISGIPLFIYLVYILFVFIGGCWSFKSFSIGLIAVWSSLIQFLAYGLGFIRATFLVRILGKSPKSVFPELFF